MKDNFPVLSRSKRCGSVGEAVLFVVDLQTRVSITRHFRNEVSKHLQRYFQSESANTGKQVF